MGEIKYLLLQLGCLLVVNMLGNFSNDDFLYVTGAQILMIVITWQKGFDDGRERGRSDGVSALMHVLACELGYAGVDALVEKARSKIAAAKARNEAVKIPGEEGE